MCVFLSLAEWSIQSAENGRRFVGDACFEDYGLIQDPMLFACAPNSIHQFLKDATVGRHCPQVTSR